MLKPPVKCIHCKVDYPFKGIFMHRRYCKSNPDAEIKISAMTGRRHTDTAKEKNRLASLKQHQEGRGSIPPSWKGKKHSEESKRKVSVSMKGNKNGKGRGISCEAFGTVFKSTWEMKVANYLTENNLLWQYETITYDLNSLGTYTPDFFIYDEQGTLLKIIEVKGYFWPKNKQKYESFKENYSVINIELWNASKLKELKLI